MPSTQRDAATSGWFLKTRSPKLQEGNKIQTPNDSLLNTNLHNLKNYNLKPRMKLSFTALALIPLVTLPAQASPVPICSTSRVLNGVHTNGSILMGGNPLTPFDSPMLSTFNSTSVEDWSFDGVSSDAQAGLSFTLSRGTTAGHIGAQRVIVTVVWPNGTRFMRSLYFDESTITSCPGSVTGTWRNTTGIPASWAFQTSDDYKHTLVTVNTDFIEGTYKLTSITPALYPNGLEYPDRNGNPLFASFLYWVENVPVGIVGANLTINGTSFILSGIGGRERNWNSKPWGEISARWDMARGTVGPYTFIAWSYLSNVDQKTYFSMVLMKHGAVVFRTQTNRENTTGSKTKMYGEIDVKSDGRVHLSSSPPGKPADSRVTGYVFMMVDSRAGKMWKFEIDFTKAVYWFPASGQVFLEECFRDRANLDRTANIGGFVGHASGGQVDGKQYVGLSSGNLQELV